MSQGRWSLPVLTLILAGGVALPALAQTTGSIQGHVLDSRKRPVPFAVVRISGASLQGVRTLAADEAGSFRFPLLPPGKYTLLATRDGMNPAKVEVTLGLDKTASVDLALTPITSAVVEVMEKLATVDTTDTTTGSNFTSEVFLTLPTSRDYADLALMTPGVTQDNAGYRVYGASGAENNWVVDGINTTNAEYGTQGKSIPIEFIQEFQVKTGGFEAEYGKATGGIVNVLTKSGGNEFTGDVFTYYEGNSLQAKNNHSNQGFDPAPQGYTTKDYGFDLGGYLVKDRLWFFVAYDRKDHTQDDLIQVGSTAGSLAHQDMPSNLFSAKLTWRLSDSQNLIASVLGDPTTTKGELPTTDGHPAIGPESSWAGVDKTGGTDYNLRYEKTGTSWFGNLQVSRHAESHSILPGPDGNGIQVTDWTNGGAVSGGFGDYRQEDFKRDNVTGTLSKFLDDWAGHHEFKVGFDVQNDTCNYLHGYTSGQMVAYYGATPGVPAYYVHTLLTGPDANIVAPLTAGGPGGIFTDVDPYIVTATPKHKGFTWFAQDKWTPTPNLIVNLGLRDDYTRVIDSAGITQLNLANQLAPRLGINYDWKGQGQDKLFLTAGRFFEGMPMDLVIRSFSYERTASVYNYDPTALVPDPNWAAGTAVGRAPNTGIVGGNYEPVDPNIKAQYTDEFIMGVETTVDNTYVLGAKFIRNYVGRAIEDALGLVNNPEGDYMIMNPGISSPVGQGYPKAVRDYKGLEFTAERKFKDHYTWRLSYLWSELSGNYEGEYQGTGGVNGTGQLDPNISSAFDEPAFLVNNHGFLSGDRRSQAKANGSYDWDCGLTLGLTATYMTGTPVTAMGMANEVTPFAYPNRYELFLAPRGAYGRTPATFQVNANLSYLIKLQGHQQLRLMADITNLLNAQTATVLDQRYNFSGLDVGQTNPNFLKGADWMLPLTVRLGVRYSF